MGESIHILADMIDQEATKRMGARAVVSMRDFMIACGATDEQLRDSDERMEILKREPWRKDRLRWVECGKLKSGLTLQYCEGKIDWSGTRFAE